MSRLRPLDLMRVGTLGLRVRVSRTCLTALGITVGIAAIVAVLGITASTDAQLEAELNALGPNLLQVEPGDSITGEEVVFDAAVAGMLERIGPVDDAAATSPVDASVRRTEFIPSGQTGGISVLVADADLLEVLDTAVARGVWLDERTSGVPVTVLGSVAARRLGVRDVAGSPLVYMSGTYFEVVGILEPVSPSPSIDRSVLIGREIAGVLFDFTAEPDRVYVRTAEWVPDDPILLDQVRAVIAATVRPQNSSEVVVSRPSDLIAAREISEAAFTGLLLGLGAVALLVGGIGIANVMVISVLERRTEIGVRRALGATKRHIRLQFVVESTLLSALGGFGGVALGAAITVGYAVSRDWVIAIPFASLGLGVSAALLIGAAAGLYPASRAARLNPAEAVHPAA